MVGDIMLARRPGQQVATGIDPFATFAEVLGQGDLTVGNLECVISTVGAEVPKLYTFRCHPQNLPFLARHFNAVSVANNHSGDFGKAAFVEQLDLLKASGIGYFGGGNNLLEAHTPLVVERNGLKIAFLGYNEVELRSYEAGPDRPGLAWSTDTAVVTDIKAAKQLYGADVVVVYPHWGLEYNFVPSQRQVTLARKMVDAGADLVVGAHPHVIQTTEVYKNRLIVYSLGNFVFDDFLDVGSDLNEPSRLSWVFRAKVGKNGIEDWDTLLARTDDQGIPRPVKGATTPCKRADSLEQTMCTNN